MPLVQVDSTVSDVNRLTRNFIIPMTAHLVDTTGTDDSHSF